MVSGSKAACIGVTQCPWPFGSDSRSVHMKKVMFLIFVLGAFMVYLFISGKA